MKRFFVSWEIELDAEDPRDAARQALAMQRDPDSTAQVFTCTTEGEEPIQVDLWADTRTVQNSEPWCPECKCVVEAIVVLNGEEVVIEWQDSDVSPSEEDGYQGPGVGSNV